MKDGMSMLLTALADCVSPRLVRYPAAKLYLGAQRDTLRTRVRCVGAADRFQKP